ncbi:MAG TPA: alpha/beta hydrolase [Vicinamibacterales bacterium]
MRVAVALFLLLAALFALIWAGQRRLMYFPFGGVPSPRDAGLPDAEPVTLTTGDGLTLSGWFLPAHDPPARFTVIVFNGNAGNRAHRAPLAAALRRHGMAVLLFDYRGFGGNPGTPTERGLAADARAARTYLASRTDVDLSRLVYFGESLGTAVAVDLAAEHPPAALVLRSPFASMAEVGQFHYPFLPVRWLLRDRFAAADVIGRVTSPVLVIAGGRDAIVPPVHSRRLYEAAREPKQLLVIEGADHNDHALFAGAELIDGVVRFLEPRR